MDMRHMDVLASGPDPWEPEAVCDRCGRRGTVVRGRRRDIAESAEWRYCGDCWPEARAEQVRASIETGATYGFMRHDPAMTWARLIALVEAAERVLPADASNELRRQGRWKAALTSVATELHYDAQRLPGPMTQKVREFIERSPRGALPNRER